MTPALLPPPLSRAHRDAQLEEARQLTADVDAFLARLDEALVPLPAGCGRTRRRALLATD